MNHCPYCKKTVVQEWSYCHYCNKPLLYNIHQLKGNNNTNQVFRRIPSYYARDQYIESNFINHDISKVVELKKQINVIDKTIQEKEYLGAPVGLLQLEKASLYYKKRDLSMALKILKTALKNFVETNDILNIAVTYNEMGIIQIDLGFFDEAIYYFERTLEYTQQINDNNKLIQIYNNLGNIYSLIKDFECSHEFFLKVFEIAKREDFLLEEIKTSNNLVESLFFFKDYDQIARILNRNLKFFKQNKDRYGIINSLIKYGKLYYLLGESYYEQSRESFINVLVLLKKISNKISIYHAAQLKWECFFYLGNLNLNWNSLETSENYLFKSLEEIRIFEVRDDLKQGMVLEALAKLFELKGETYEAIDYYLLSCEIYYRFGDDYKNGLIKSKIARIYLEIIENESKAIGYYKEALKTFESKDFYNESAQILRKLGDLASVKGMNDLASSYFERARKYCEKENYSF